MRTALMVMAVCLGASCVLADSMPTNFPKGTTAQPLRLKPHEWKSGDILRIVAAAGEPRADGDPVS